MLRKQDQMRNVSVEKPRGGEGTVHFTHILEPDEILPSCTMFARLQLEPGAAVGEHAHTDDAEVYYILSGTMEVNDNGVLHKIGPGDVVYTAGGETHSIRNIGNETAEMLAVILR